MNGLNLELFLRSADDIERGKYELMHELKGIREHFAKSRLYPHLSQLVNIHSVLTQIVDSAGGIRKILPKRIKEIDMRNRRVIYDAIDANPLHLQQIEELIHWAIPKIKAMIDEGKTIYEFVDDNMSVEVVGILPTYLEEGYFFVPNNKDNSCHLIHYEVSIYTSSDERYRSLKTRVVEKIASGDVQAPAQSLKMELIKRYPDLPNPATYQFETDLDFPFAETVFPVAKRRLLQCLYS